jgi:hypothetical protein
LHILHTYLNKTLPYDIIQHIILYLSCNDIINLGISKLFLPALIYMPTFWTQVNTYLSHILCVYFHSKQNLFVKCVLRPIILNNYFYFSVDTSKLLFMHHVFDKSTPIPLVDKSIANIIKYFVNPFNLKTKHKITLTNNLTLCHSLCICHLIYTRK